MPEGDTIFQAASQLRPLLERREVRVWTRPRAERHEREVRELLTRGKHLVFAFEGGDALRVHLGMGGSWHRYDHGERWWRPEAEATVVFETRDDVVVCFGSPEARWFRLRDLEAVLGHLGPDLLAEPDLDEVVRRSRALAGGQELGVLLLDQRVACGLGNVYKSEVLFLERRDPFGLVDDLDDGQLLALWTVGRDLIVENREQPRRVTRHGPGPDHWVYGRARRGCFRCRSPIQSSRQGEQQRTTYWCPRCQPASR